MLLVSDVNRLSLKSAPKVVVENSTLKGASATASLPRKVADEIRSRPAV